MLEFKFKYEKHESWDDYYSVIIDEEDEEPNWDEAINEFLKDFDSVDGYPDQVIFIKCGEVIKKFKAVAEFSVDWSTQELESEISSTN